MKAFLVFGIALAACGGASYQTMHLVNRTDRAIEAIYVYPTGAADHGASRGGLAPSASTQLQVRAGRTSVLALSAKLKIDEHTRDQPSASQDLEISGPTEIVFYDAAGDKPPGLERPGVFGIAFQLPKPAPPPPDPQ
jgi:hypothetical protein